MNNETKYASIDVKSSKDNDRVIEFVASKEMVDYDNDVVKIDGLDIKKIKKNKSFLWSHQSNMPPIGKIISLKKDGKQLIGKAQLTSEEEYPFGFTIYKLIKNGYINNISISFLPDYNSIEYKEKDGKQIRYINKSTLLEVSAVNIGANPGTSIATKSYTDAASKALEAGDISDSELKQLIDILSDKEDKKDENKEEKTVEELEEEIKQLKDYISMLEDELEKTVEIDKYEIVYNQITGTGTDKSPDSTNSDIYYTIYKSLKE